MRLTIRLWSSVMAVKKTSDAQRARELIKKNFYLTLASCGANVPWASPIYYMVDGRWTFYFVCKKDATHARNIRANEKVSWVVFDARKSPRSRNCVQIEGGAYQVELLDVPLAISTYFGREETDVLKERIENVFGADSFVTKTDYRFFKLIPYRVFLLDSSLAEDDLRIEVNLAAP